MDSLKKSLSALDAKVKVQRAPNKEVQKEIADLSEVRIGTLALLLEPGINLMRGEQCEAIPGVLNWEHHFAVR